MSNPDRRDRYDLFLSALASGAGCPSNAYLLHELVMVLDRNEPRRLSPARPAFFAGLMRLLTKGVTVMRNWLLAWIVGHGGDDSARRPEPDLPLR
jgi:hypothetical protein